MRIIAFMAALSTVAAAVSCISDSPAEGDVLDHWTADAAVKDLPAVDFTPGPKPQTLPLFDQDTIVRFDLTFTPAAWNSLMDCWRNPSPGVRDGTQKCYVHCGFAFGDEGFEDAACRPKGNPEAWSEQDKPQFIVRFNKWDKSGRFRGMRRLNLEANPNGGVPIRDRLGMWLMRQSGIDASRVNDAVVTVNGENYGLYMNIETLDQEFLDTHFDYPDGNLYSDGPKLETNEKANDISDVDAWDEQIMDEPLGVDHTSFAETLSAMMDVDQMLRVMAAEIVLPTVDNLKDGGGNFYLYHHPVRGFLVLPWDLDDIFSKTFSGPDQPFDACRGPVDLSTEPSKICQLVHDHPPWREKLVQDVIEIRDQVYALIPDKVDDYCAQVRDEFAKDPFQSYGMDDFDADCKYIKDYVASRTAYLKDYLGR